MTKRSLAFLIIGVLLAGGAAAAIASSIGGSDSPEVHKLQDGSVHTGPMPPPGSDAGDTSDGSHQMEDGARMKDSDMDPGESGAGRQEDMGGGESMEGMGN